MLIWNNISDKCFRPVAESMPPENDSIMTMKEDVSWNYHGVANKVASENRLPICFFSLCCSTKIKK